MRKTCGLDINGISALAEETQAIHLNLDEVPARKREALAQSALELMQQVFSMPGAEEEFRAWQVEYRKRTAAEAAE